MYRLRFLIIQSIICLGLSPSTTAQNQFLPPGTIKVSSNKFVDNIPVSNLMYLEYLNVTDNFNTSNYPDFNTFLVTEYAVPEQGILIEIPLKCVDIELDYDKYSAPQFIRKPVLVQNKSEAIKFCAWRSKMVNHFYSVAANPAKNAMAGKIEYRLPTITEQEYFRSLFKQRNRYKKFKGRLKDIDSNESRYIEYNRGEFSATAHRNKTKDGPGMFRCVCEIKK